MKILFFISVHGHGRGGHFHSLNHISMKIGEEHDVKIISFGPGKSDIIESNPHFLRHINFKGLDFFKLRKIIKQEARIFNPDIFHCFDVGSYNIIRLIIPSNKNILVLNKCGGPNPKYYPYVNNLILFSQENLDWFKNQQKFHDSNIHLIPNRVNAIRPDKTFQPIKKKPDEFVFMRICRIGNGYKKSIDDSIHLIEYLHAKNIHNVKLYVIGAVEDSDLLENYKNHTLVKKEIIVFLTDYIYTSEASKMLYLADALIGTGRGLMEAASLSIPLLAINAKGNIPILLNNINFENAFKTNFSERNEFPDLDNEANLNNIVELIQNENYYAELSKFSKTVFEKHFDLNKVAEAYPSVYKQSTTGKRKLWKDTPLILKSIVNFYRSYLKTKSK